MTVGPETTASGKPCRDMNYDGTATLRLIKCMIKLDCFPLYY